MLNEDAGVRWPGAKWVHDCDHCVPLGPYFAFGKVHDLYWCEQGGRPTVIARYSDDGPDYTSGVAARVLDPRIAEACRRAELLGLPLSVEEMSDAN